jgi:hypothetical protein
MDQILPNLKDRVKDYLLKYYTTAPSPIEAKFHYTTKEVWEQLQQIFPTSEYSIEDVALWLHEGKFNFFDFGNMNFEWLLNKI